jgi:pSer/pThr/pTyr-binding forkhead associated (FHA) protein
MSARGRQPDVRKVRADEIKEEKTLPIAGWLLILNGKHKGEDFRLREGKNTVGSEASCEVVLTDDHISTKHANIHVKRATETTGSYSVMDLDSTNGTFLNDSQEKIAKEELVDNDTVRFGTTRCKFKCV